ncbi:MAG: alpha/beta hydrolase [Roseiflexaceae bacterium]|nr:alpha/beta hydrolase [Roseiflexaceae bacterium]
MIPTAIIAIWFSGLFSLGIIGGAVYLLREWYRNSWVYDAVLDQTVFNPDFGLNAPTALLVSGLLLLLWAVAGGLIVRLFLRLISRSSTENPPTGARDGRIQKLPRPDGTELQVEHYGLATGPVLIFTHGWGTDSTEWYAAKRDLRDRFHLIVWDLPGIAESTRPNNHDYSLEKFASDLNAVVGLADGQPVILVGHSIGGMVTLTFCRLFPEALGTRVAGLVLVHTTYTNPVRTTTLAALNTALERPVIVPLLHLMIWLSPLVWAMNWLSYLNGSSHLSTKLSGFAGTETWQQIDFASRYGLYISPAVLARGMFGMLRYDATATLKTIRIPALVVAANRDPVCKPEASARISQDVPTAQSSPLAPAKHMGFMEHHTQFAELVGDFAASCLR